MQNSFLVYLDILGYKEMLLEEISKNGKSSLLLEKFKQEVVHEINKLKRRFKSKVFTDNIVLVHPIDRGSDGEGEYGEIVRAVSKFQLALVLNGYFVRGGFVRGEAYIDHDIVFGSPLIEAYELENCKAIDPRIIFSNDVLNMLKEHSRYYSDPYDSPQNSEVLLDVDGMCFLNYLLWVVEDSDEVNLSLLNGHKAVVEQKLKAFRNNPKIWSKYFWSGNYHNYFVDLIRDSLDEPEGYKINNLLLRKSPERLIAYPNELDH